MRNEQLTRAMRMANESTQNLIVDFFELLRVADPLAAAQIVHGTILNLEYQVLSGAIALESPLLERTVTMMIRGLIPANLTATQPAHSQAGNH